MPSDFEVEYTLQNPDLTYRIRLWQGQVMNGLDMESDPVTVKKSIVNGDRYFLVIPKSAINNNLTIYFPDEFDISVDGKKLANGEEIKVFSEGEHVLMCNGQENKLYCHYLSDIPSVYLEIEENSEFNIYSQSKTSGKITVVNNGTVEYNGPLEYIKGRGNTTWFTIKKPYNIKLVKKANILGMGKEKNIHYWQIIMMTAK